MELKVDRDLCESTAVCVGIAPDIFSLGDDDLAQVPVGEVPPAREAAIREAAAVCPKMALSLHTD
jgi:ferredoxin